MASHVERDAQLTENVRRAQDHVDAVVFVNGNPNARFAIESWPSVITVRRPWSDDFPAQRNAYLDVAGELAAADDLLLCVFDTDEFYSDGLWRNVRRLGDWALEHDKNQLAIRSHDVTLTLDGTPIATHVSDYFKALLLLWEPGMRYVSVGYDGQTESTDSHVHEWLRIPSGARLARIDTPDWYYEHRKEMGATWLRAARNVWAGGGGRNLGRHAAVLWEPLKHLVRRHHPHVRTSMDFETQLRVGLHPEIREFLLSIRHLGTDHDARRDLWPTWPDGTSEYREIVKAYFALYHPDELPASVVLADAGKIDWAADIMAIHGALPTSLCPHIPSA